MPHPEQTRRLAGKLGAGRIGPACWPEKEKSDLQDYRAALRDFGHENEMPERRAGAMEMIWGV